MTKADALLIMLRCGIVGYVIVMIYEGLATLVMYRTRFQRALKDQDDWQIELSCFACMAIIAVIVGVAVWYAGLPDGAAK